MADDKKPFGDKEDRPQFNRPPVQPTPLKATADVPGIGKATIKVPVSTPPPAKAEKKSEPLLVKVQSVRGKGEIRFHFEQDDNKTSLKEIHGLKLTLVQDPYESKHAKGKFYSTYSTPFTKEAWIMLSDKKLV